MKNFFFSLLNGFTTILLLGLVALLLVPLLPIPGNIQIKIVKSGSMEPSIQTGGIVVIKPASSYAVGDVITFGKDTKTDIPTTHRIMDIGQENGSAFFTTQGDANEEIDPQPVREGEVIGKVLFTLPYAGYLLDFSRQPLGFALLIGVPALAVIVNEFLAILSELRRPRRKDTTNMSPKKRTALASGNVSLDEPLYVRERRMDDVALPVHTASIVRRPTRRVDSILVTCLISALIGGTSASAVGNIGTTVSFYRDTEHAVQNSLAAAALDFSLMFPVLPDTLITLIVTEGDASGVSVMPQLTIDLPSGEPEYTVRVEKIGGDEPFCSQVMVSGAGLFAFSVQPLLALPQQGPTVGTTPWTLTFTLPEPADGVSTDDECIVDLVYEGKISGGDIAYNDEERIHLLLRADTLIEEAPLLLSSPSPVEEPELPEEVVEESESTEEEQAGEEPPQQEGGGE